VSYNDLLDQVTNLIVNHIDSRYNWQPYAFPKMPRIWRGKVFYIYIYLLDGYRSRFVFLKSILLEYTFFKEVI